MEELTVANLIHGVEKKQFLLPTIQRGFVWEAKKIETLFDSLMRDFPISSFLFWEVPDEDEQTFKFYDFIKDYNFYGDDLRTFANFGKSPHMAVLDGQQRITSFYIGLKGSYIPKGKSETPQKLYLNLLKINADSDIGDDDAGLDNVYNFKFLTDAAAAKRDDETFWFEVGKIFDKRFNESADIADYLLENNLVDGYTHSYLKLPYRILNRLWSRVKTKLVIEYHLESNKSLDEVLNIFVRINNGGKPVELSELLISLATAQLKNFDVENNLIRLVNEINYIGGEKSFNVSKDFILKTFLVLCDDGSRDRESIKFTVENFKPQRMKKIRADWDKMSDAIKSAVKLVNEFGFNQKNFTSNNALIPIAQYIYLKNNDAEKFFADKGKMIHWFISATLNGIFSSRTDEKLTKFRNLLNDNHENFPLVGMLGAKNKSENELADDLINALMNTNYKALKNVLMALTILYDGKKDLSTVDVDHMFPKIKIKNLGEMAQQGIADENKFQTDYEKFCNALPNLQLLDSAENRKKSSTYFSDWVKTQPAEYLAENFVPNVDFRLVNFKNFVDARAKLIREKIFENLKSHGIIFFGTSKIISPDIKKPARKLEDILNMATRIEKQFANAAVTSDGKFMFYADHGGVEIKPGAPKWNPSFWIIKKDLISKRVSLDIITQEVAPHNLFVEVTKVNVDNARKVAKKRGYELALQYLEDTGRK